MAKPNYQFEKRRRELDKKRKDEEKKARKAERARAEAAGEIVPSDTEPTMEAEPETN